MSPLSSYCDNHAPVRDEVENLCTRGEGWSGSSPCCVGAPSFLESPRGRAQEAQALPSEAAFLPLPSTLHPCRFAGKVVFIMMVEVMGTPMLRVGCELLEHDERSRGGVQAGAGF